MHIVVMAAGLGSRFGGPKQLEPVGPCDETLIDYLLFDAWRAGFETATLVIRDELAQAVDSIASRHQWRMKVGLAVQTFAPERPRGTVPAVLAARDAIDGPFAALNADDFYGADAYRRAAAFLADGSKPMNLHAVVALPLASTLSAHGSVVRGVCETRGDVLVGLEEVRGIERRAGEIVAGMRRFTGAERVSMNFWAFQPGMLRELAGELDAFSRGHDSRHELLLPIAVHSLLTAGRIQVRVLDAPGPWLGLTHVSDRAPVRQALADAASRGDYPAPVWMASGHR